MRVYDHHYYHMRTIIVPVALIATLSALASCSSDNKSPSNSASSNIPGASANGSSY